MELFAGGCNAWGLRDVGLAAGASGRVEQLQVKLAAETFERMLEARSGASVRSMPGETRAEALNDAFFLRCHRNPGRFRIAGAFHPFTVERRDAAPYTRDQLTCLRSLDVRSERLWQGIHACTR